MEPLKQTYDQFRKVWLSLTAGQRATLIVAPLIVAGGIFLLARSHGDSAYVSLSLGKTFTAEEMAAAARTLSSAGLNDFRQQGQQILVPGDQVSTYNAALVASGNLPSGWASDWERKFDKQSGIFTSAEHLQNIKEIQLAKALREMIVSVPDVEDASVIWTPPKKHAWRRDSCRTATVSVKTRPGRELSMGLIQGIRHSVAGAIDDLKPENVVVFDQVKMTAFTPEHDGDPNGGRILSQIKEFTALYQKKISEQLKFIPGVIVTVDVEMDGSKTADASVAPAANNEMNTSGMPKSVQVSISIPNDYYRAVAAEQLRADGSIGRQTDNENTAHQKSINSPIAAVEEQIKNDVREIVERSIPRQASRNAVVVSSYVRGEPEGAKSDATAEPNTINSLLRKWGALIGLAFVALLGIRMIGRGKPQSATFDESDNDEVARLAEQLAETAIMPEPIPLPSRRTELQTAVRDNPEMAAAVLGQWLRSDH